MTNAKSPLTGLEVQCDREALADITYYHDPVCGEYAVGFDSGLEPMSLGDKQKIAKVLATRTLRTGIAPILLTNDRTGMDGVWECVPTATLLAQYPSDVVSVLDEALLNMSKMIGFPSDRIEIDNQNRWYVFAHDHNSEEYMLRQLLDAGFIKHAGNRPGGAYMIQSYTIEAKGWARLRELHSDSHKSDQVFVAMWFNEEMQEFYVWGIEPAIREAGFRPIRIDLKEHNNKICDEIIAEIRRCRFLVADFSSDRGGVYYEAGFAYGLGKSVIWTVRKDFLDRVHFDTRQYNHIVYETTEELRERLLQRIRATQK